MTTDTMRALREQRFDDPRPVRFLFNAPVMGFLWLFIRVFLGWQWLISGWHKVYGDSAIGWTRDGTNAQGKFVHAGDSILGFWNRAAAVPEQGMPPITYDWYRGFIQYMIDHRWNGWMTYVIAYGEVLVGVALIVGACTELAAFFGATMNMNYLLAGSASTNPVLFFCALLMILAWKTAGYIGLDRWLLPALGTPWQPGQLFTPQRARRGATLADRATAFAIALAVWILAACVVVFIAAKGDVLWDLKAGYVLELLTVTAAFSVIDFALSRLGLEPPFRPSRVYAGRPGTGVRA